MISQPPWCGAAADRIRPFPVICRLRTRGLLLRFNETHYHPPNIRYWFVCVNGNRKVAIIICNVMSCRLIERWWSAAIAIAAMTSLSPSSCWCQDVSVAGDGLRRFRRSSSSTAIGLTAAFLELATDQTAERWVIGSDTHHHHHHCQPARNTWNIFAPKIRLFGQDRKIEKLIINVILILTGGIFQQEIYARRFVVDDSRFFQLWLRQSQICWDCWIDKSTNRKICKPFCCSVRVCVFYLFEKSGLIFDIEIRTEKSWAAKKCVPTTLSWPSVCTDWLPNCCCIHPTTSNCRGRCRRRLNRPAAGRPVRQTNADQKSTTVTIPTIFSIRPWNCFSSSRHQPLASR